MANEYPIGSFHFAVTFLGLGASPYDVSFQSVSGLDVQIETEPIKEGGENEFTHVVPTRRKYTDLVLKRGVISDQSSPVMEWFKKAIEGKNLGKSIEPKDLLVVLLNHNHIPLVYWEVFHAWPKNWKYSELNAEKGEVLIETMELNYNRYVIKGR